MPSWQCFQWNLWGQTCFPLSQNPRTPQLMCLYRFLMNCLKSKVFPLFCPPPLALLFFFFVHKFITFIFSFKFYTLQYLSKLYSVVIFIQSVFYIFSYIDEKPCYHSVYSGFNLHGSSRELSSDTSFFFSEFLYFRGNPQEQYWALELPSLEFLSKV